MSISPIVLVRSSNMDSATYALHPPFKALLPTPLEGRFKSPRVMLSHDQPSDKKELAKESYAPIVRLLTGFSLEELQALGFGEVEILDHFRVSP